MDDEMLCHRHGSLFKPKSRFNPFTKAGEGYSELISNLQKTDGIQGESLERLFDEVFDLAYGKKLVNFIPEDWEKMQTCHEVIMKADKEVDSVVYEHVRRSIKALAPLTREVAEVISDRDLDGALRLYSAIKSNGFDNVGGRLRSMVEFLKVLDEPYMLAITDPGKGTKEAVDGIYSGSPEDLLAFSKSAFEKSAESLAVVRELNQEYTSKLNYIRDRNVVEAMLCLEALLEQMS